MADIATDCRSEEGVTIGLIDSLITISRVLARRNLRSSLAVLEALRDLDHDEDVAAVKDAATDATLCDPEGRAKVCDALATVKQFLAEHGMEAVPCR